MRKSGKKFAAARQQVPERPHTIEEAVSLMQKGKFAKFDETVELAMRLGVDPKHADQMVRGKVEFRVDKTGIIHAPVGKASFPAQSLIENAHALVDSVVKAKPAAAKGKYLRSVTLSSTMGPGITIDTTHVTETVKH